ncbi:MAG TPA: glycosyltransferase family 4 protein [Vicinamibacterales bacterium]|nr:glycosyltransferase family 4 protein [Vicinamibacterales bacterium]
MKVAVVVQRYGADINGGAELHARYIAERLARRIEVEVFTTCARDYITWKNELPPGPAEVNRVHVHRFPVSTPRRPDHFGRLSHLVFDRRHSVADELRWLASEGPTSPALIAHLRKVQAEFDFFIFFSYRYYHAWHGARAVPDKAILVPTAERDPALGVSIFGPVLAGARAIMYNSLEERAIIEHVSRREGPSIVVGVGSEIPTRTDPRRVRRTYNVRRPFVLYIGRVDENKGCVELFDLFQRYAATDPRGLDLLLVGSHVLEIPKHPRIRHLGFLSDADKFDVLAAADVLVMPSRYESLSMVVIEAWALGKPVLVNGRCDVLRGQVVRSRGGLYYENAEEFAECLYTLEGTGPLGGLLGANGREYFRQHYTWPVIERKYLEMLDRLSREKAGSPMPALPGWLARRRRDLEPARTIVDAAPSGPVVRR